jgi:sugar diacid utilization regulator
MPKPKAARRKKPAGRSKKPRSRSKAVKRPVSAAEPPHATLGGLVDSLGAEVFRVLSAPAGLDVKVTEPVIHDALQPIHFEVGDLVLAVGVAPSDRHASEVIGQAGVSRAAGVIFKLHDEAAELAEAGERAEVALVGVQPEMTWNQLYGLLKTAIASSGQVPQGEAADIPVGDLFALANAVSAMVGGAVTIEDTQSRVLAFSSLDEPIDDPRRQTILGRRVPEPWVKRLHEHGVFRKLWSTEDVVRVKLPYKGLRPRLAIAVRAGGEILGSVWVLEGKKRLGAAAEEALREAARIAALHLIRHRASEDLERRMRGDFLRSVLEGRGPIEHLASRLGIDVKSPFTVVGFDLASSDRAEAGLQRQRALEIVAANAEGFHRRAASVSLDRTLYTLLPTPPGTEREVLAGLAGRMVEQSETSTRVPLRAGIGSTVPSLREAPRSRAEADRVLRVLGETAQDRRVATIEDLQAQALVLELQDVLMEHPHLRIGRVTALVQYDAEHGTSYVQTLRAYLDSFGDVGKAAALVNVHPNTFRYRIKRVSELSEIDLDDPDERLVAEIQLRTL